MKIFYLIIIALLFFGSMDLDAQQRAANKFYVQAGGGINLYNHLQQVGFAQQSRSYTGYVEIAQDRSLWRFGGFITTGQSHNFYIHTLSEDHMGIYGKLNLGPLIPILPFGIDPYLYGASSMSHADFATADIDQPNDASFSQIMRNNTVKYSFGGGIDIGSKLVVVGLHYAFSPGKETFNRPELDPITFLTNQHNFEVRLGFRLHPQFSKNSVHCPRMGRRGKGQLFF